MAIYLMMLTLSLNRYFHGTNVVYKRAPFYPKTDSFDAQFSYADEDMQLMKDMGYNVIRLGTSLG